MRSDDEINEDYGYGYGSIRIGSFFFFWILIPTFKEFERKVQESSYKHWSLLQIPLVVETAHDPGWFYYKS